MDENEKEKEKSGEKLIVKPEEKEEEDKILRKTIDEEKIIPVQVIKKRYFGMDLIRVISCYMVMQVHAAEYYYIGGNLKIKEGEGSKWPGYYSSLCRASVPLFVMISGYLLLPLKDNLSTFLKKRFMRVAIPFIVFCIGYDIYFRIRDRITTKDMILNIPKIFVNFGTDVGHLWYIYMILGIYLFIPIISPWLKNAPVSHFFYYFSFWGLSMFLHYIHLYTDKIWGEAVWNETHLLTSFKGNFGYAVLGAFVKMHLKDYDLYYLGGLLVIIGTGITMFGFLYLRTRVDNCVDLELSWNFDTINVAMTTLGIFLLLRKINCKNEKVKALFNDIAIKSYGMYLIHIFFLDFFYYIYDGEKRHPSWSIFTIAIPTFIVSYGAVKLISYIPYSKYIIG